MISQSELNQFFDGYYNRYDAIARSYSCNDIVFDEAFGKAILYCCEKRESVAHIKQLKALFEKALHNKVIDVIKKKDNQKVSLSNSNLDQAFAISYYENAEIDRVLRDLGGNSNREDIIVDATNPVVYLYNNNTYGISKSPFWDKIQKCMNDKLTYFDEIAKGAIASYCVLKKGESFSPEFESIENSLKDQFNIPDLRRKLIECTTSKQRKIAKDRCFDEYVSNVLDRIKGKVKFGNQMISVQILHRSGMLYYNKREYKKSIRYYSKVLEIIPDHLETLANRGVVYHDKGEYSKAISDFSRAIEIAPSKANFYYNRGLSYKQIEMYDKAIADFSEAILIFPKYFDAYNNRGIAHHETGEYSKALSDYSKAIEIDGERSESYSNRGLSFYTKGMYEEAILDYSEAIKIDPKFSGAYNNRGIAHETVGKNEEAILDYSKAIEMGSKNADIYYNRGILFCIKHDYSNAISDYSEALKITPFDPDLFKNRGYAYEAAGESDKAAQDFAKYKELTGESVE